MAYAALISLKHTILRFVNSSPEAIEFAYNEVESLQEVLKRLDSNSSSSRKRLNALDGQIREAVYKLEDVIESHVSDQLISQSESLGNEGCSLILSIVVEEVRQDINSFMEVVKKMEEEYIKELDNPLPEEEDDAVSSRIDFGGNKSNVVGLSDDEITDIKYQLTARRPYEFGVFSIVGMAGTGRTVLAKLVFEQPSLCRHFDRRAWVTIGPKYQIKEILICILSQIDPDQGNDKLLISEGDEKLAEHLYTSLKGTQYLIALDDVCDTQIWEYLRRLFPEEYNGSRVLLTTSREEVAQFVKSVKIYPMAVMNKEKSWGFLRKKVFGKQFCPPQLEKAGKKIAENCEGLRLEIIKAALFLSEAEKTPEHWNKVAAERENSVFKDAYDEMSEVSKFAEYLQLGISFYDSDDDDFSTTESAIAKVFGLSYAIHKIIRDLFSDESFSKPKIISFFGMAGIGKTTLAKTIFEDTSISHHFDHLMWVTLGPKYQSERIFEDILAQIDPDIDKIRAKGDEIFAEHFFTMLSCKRCLIVLDDVWNIEPLDYLYELYPDILFAVLLTTRLKEVAHFAEFGQYHEIVLLNKEESWYLLREKLFGEKLCPHELEKAGKTIAKNCDGLPLMIVTVASLLSEAEKTPAFWNKVAKKENLLFEHAYDKILKVLYPSYEYLPQHLKACFLYMGVFPQNYEIPTSKLFKLWNYEGILEPNLAVTLEDLAMKYLMELVSRSLLVAGKEKYGSKIKTCSLHSVFWHFCIREARKTQFFHVLNRYADGLGEHIKLPRRLCIQNNILFGIKDVYDSTASISTMRSLLCTGPPHQYPVPICSGLRLLRVLDALTIRFYMFPTEVLKLVQLRYLALTCNGNLPSSISRLWNLELLIVNRQLSIKSSGAPSYLPMEIWDMQELKHLQVMGSILPDPCGLVLPKLSTLLDVSAHSSIKGVLRGTPKLEELGIRIELTPDASEPLFSFDYISHLDGLKSLKCVVVNPELRYEVVPPPTTLSMLPTGLKELSLSGLGYPWHYIRIIASLPNLKVLKLRCHTFRGPEWIMRRGEFKRLRYLLIEDSDVEYLSGDDGCFEELKRLIIRQCYKLKEYPEDSLGATCKIELIDCNPSASNHIPHDRLELNFATVHSSWESERLVE